VSARRMLPPRTTHAHQAALCGGLAPRPGLGGPALRKAHPRRTLDPPRRSVSFRLWLPATDCRRKVQWAPELIHALSLHRDHELSSVLSLTMGYVRSKQPAELTAVIEAWPAEGIRRQAIPTASCGTPRSPCGLLLKLTRSPHRSTMNSHRVPPTPTERDYLIPACRFRSGFRTLWPFSLGAFCRAFWGFLHFW